MPHSDTLDADKIQTNLKTKWLGKKIVIFKSTASTNDIAAEYSKSKDNDGLVVLTEQQTKGRGRTGNKWVSGISDSILCSILLTNSSCNAELLSLTCPIAVTEAIGHKVKIKWPNDILINNKKVAGILLETKSCRNDKFFIIGIGINCHQKSFPVELKQTATSLDIETHTKCDRILLIKRLLTSMEHWLNIAENNPAKIIERWRKLSILLGKRITVIYNRRRFTGNCIGIDPEKGLILQLDRGAVRMFDASLSTIEKS